MEELKGIVHGLPTLALLSLTAMFLVNVAITADLVSGWRKAKLRREAHTSYAFSRTLTKFLLYMGILIIGGCVDMLIHFVCYMFGYCYIVPSAIILLAIVLCIVEMWSIREKADEKTRNSMKNAMELVQKTLTHDQVTALLAEAIEKASAGGKTSQSKFNTKP